MNNNFDTVREALALATDGPIVDRDGMMAQALSALDLIQSDHARADLEAEVARLREALENMTQLCAIKYGNLYADVWAEIKKARALLKETP